MFCKAIPLVESPSFTKLDDNANNPRKGEDDEKQYSMDWISTESIKTPTKQIAKTAFNSVDRRWMREGERKRARTECGGNKWSQDPVKKLYNAMNYRQISNRSGIALQIFCRLVFGEDISEIK